MFRLIAGALISIFPFIVSFAEDNLKSSIETVKTGGIELIELKNGYKVWTKRVKGGEVPVLTLHGGPGCTHEYLECLEDFLPEKGFQVIYYDQLGSHYSDQPTDLSLWTLERFCEEVEEVRQALGLENFYLYGQSWGGLLAMEYALKYQKHLKGLIISNMTASVPCYVDNLNRLRLELSPEKQDVLRKYEEKGEYNAPEYEQIMLGEIYSKHLCRITPWPEPFQRTFKHLNVQIYHFMQGPNEFIVTGNLKDWDRWDRISNIEVPTLLIGARYDTMNPEEIRKMGTFIPHSRVHICENGSHLAMYDDQESYFQHLLRFLDDVENGRVE